MSFEPVRIATIRILPLNIYIRRSESAVHVGIKSGRMRSECGACMEDNKYACKMFIGKPQRKTPL
jgi:hypothetical protein